MQMQMQVSFSQKGMVVAVGERRVMLGRRARLTMAFAFTLLVHIVLLWSLSQSRTKDMDIRLNYDPDDVDTQLVRPEPIPEPIPPQHQLRQEPLSAAPPVPRPEVEPAPSPQPQPSPQPAPQQAQVEPTPTPSPQRLAPRQLDNVQAINTPTSKALSQQPTLQDSNANVPTVSDEPSPTPQKVKKKEEEQALDAKRQMAAVPAAPSDLNLHEAPTPDINLSPVAPSGLTPSPSSKLAAGGGAPAAGGSTAPGGQGGAGLKGRGSATQALQNHEDCITRQTEGKPIPPSCKMKDYASMQSTGPRPDADFQAAAARRDARLKYKTSPGNADYWNRVGHNPSTYKPSENDHPTPGSYDSAKDQRVMTHQ